MNNGRPVENIWKKRKKTDHRIIDEDDSNFGYLTNCPHSLSDDPFYLQCLINRENGVILEMGCNDGIDTKKLLDIFPTAEIHCFEPEPRAIQQFKSEINEKRCILHEVAIGVEDGVALFHQSSGTKEGAHKQDWDLSGSLNEPTGHLQYSPWVTFDNKIEVPVRSLDAYIEKNFKKIPKEFDLFWLDVQGGERNVMLGGRETLKRTRYIYAEYGHWKRPLYEGQMTLDETVDELGPDWEPLATYEGYNLLAINKELVKS